MCFGSFQDYLGKNKAGGIKAQNEWVHSTQWDCVVFDEYHYGAWRESAKELFEAEDKKELQTVVRGRDLGSGLPKSMKFTGTEIREALAPTLQQIVRAVMDVLEETPPELVSDIIQHGITMAGGGSLIRGLDKMVSESTRMPVWVTDEPMSAVVRGCGKLLTDERLLKKVKVGARLRY